jgi:hypothetical protein
MRDSRSGGDAVIVASMATLPGRRDIALRAVASLLPQVDALYLWLDKHTDAEVSAATAAFDDMWAGLPDFAPLWPFVFVFGDKGDGGKFHPLPWLADDDVWLICDDDIEYPSDYAATMSDALDIAESGGSAVVGLHALRLPERCTSYRGQRERVQHCLRYGTRPAHRHGECVRAHVLGTSSVATRPRYLRGFEAVDVSSPPNVGDLHLAAWCERQGIPRYCLPLPRERWLRNLLPGDAPSIWDGDASGGRGVQVANEDAVVSSVEWRAL